MNLLIGPVMVGIIKLDLVGSCVILCSNWLLAVGKIDLNLPLIKTKIS